MLQVESFPPAAAAITAIDPTLPPPPPPKPVELIATNDLTIPGVPPFPDDVATAPLLRLSLQRLLEHDPAEHERLWQACCGLGFFYLDLRVGVASANPDTLNRRDSGTTSDLSDGIVDGPALLDDAAALFQLGHSLFALPDDEKQRYDYKDRGSYFGYKGLGQGIIDGRGTRDRNEFYNVSKDDILEVNPDDEPLPAPALLRDPNHRALLKSYMQRCHAIVTLLLARLNERLGLPPETLPALHRLRGVSGDQVRWVHAPPPHPQDHHDPDARERELALGQHTDFGSVTILFNRLGGLQILPPASTDHQDATAAPPTWCYVKPLAGHCVVNLGDALVKFTAGILRSNIHRVTTPPGAQAASPRYSLVYFARPEDSVVLKALEGSALIDAKRKTHVEFAGAEHMTAKEWTLRRAMGRRVGGDFVGTLGTEAGRA